MVIRYDSRGVKPVQFSDPVPNGEYILQIIKAEETKSSKGLPMIKITCTVQSPSEFSGFTVPHYITIIKRGDPGAGMAIHFLKTIGQPWEESENLDIDSQAWIYSKFKARVVQEPYIKPDGTTIQTNKIKAVAPLTDDGVPF